MFCIEALFTIRKSSFYGAVNSAIAYFVLGPGELQLYTAKKKKEKNY